LHRMCDRLQRDGSTKAKLADDLAAQLSEQKRALTEQKTRAQALTIDKIEHQRLSADQEELKRQLEAAKRMIDMFGQKYEQAERTIMGQDNLISQLKAEIESFSRTAQRPPRIPSASPSRHKTAWEQQSVGAPQPQFGGTVSRRDFGGTSLDSFASRERPDSASSPLRPSTYGPGGWGGVASSPSSSQLERSSSGRAKKTYLMM
jgi:hypothetical protein